MSVAGGGDTLAALAHAGVLRPAVLRLDRRRRVPRMARGQGAAGRGGALPQVSHGSSGQARGRQHGAAAGRFPAGRASTLLFLSSSGLSRGPNLRLMPRHGLLRLHARQPASRHALRRRHQRSGAPRVRTSLPAVPGFTRRYEVERLVWFEAHDEIAAAIQREKNLKRWLRAWKIALDRAGQPGLARPLRGGRRLTAGRAWRAGALQPLTAS